MPFFSGYKDKTAKLFNPMFPFKKIQQSELFYLLRQRKGSMCSNQKLKGPHLLAKPPVSRCMHIMILKSDNGTLESYQAMK